MQELTTSLSIASHTLPPSGVEASVVCATPEVAACTVPFPKDSRSIAPSTMPDAEPILLPIVPADGSGALAIFSDYNLTLRVAEAVMPLLYAYGSELSRYEHPAAVFSARLSAALQPIVETESADVQTQIGLLESALNHSARILCRRYDQIAADLKTGVEGILSNQFSGQPAIAVLPTALIIKLPDPDFHSYMSARKLLYVGVITLGTTLACDDVAPDLRGRLVLVGTGGDGTMKRDSEAVQQTSNHELLHSIFRLLYTDSPLYTEYDHNQMLALIPTSAPTEDYYPVIDKIARSLEERTRSEVISYVCTDELYPAPNSCEVHMWPAMLEVAKRYFDNHPEINPETAVAVLERYREEMREYDRDARIYLETARQLYLNEGRNVSLVARLMSTRLHESSRLGVRPASFSSAA